MTFDVLILIRHEFGNFTKPSLTVCIQRSVVAAALWVQAQAGQIAGHAPSISGGHDSAALIGRNRHFIKPLRSQSKVLKRVDCLAWRPGPIPHFLIEIGDSGIDIVRQGDGRWLDISLAIVRDRKCEVLGREVPSNVLAVADRNAGVAFFDILIYQGGAILNQEFHWFANGDGCTNFNELFLVIAMDEIAQHAVVFKLEQHFFCDHA